MDKKVTVRKFATEMGIPLASAYKLINEGKVKTVPKYPFAKQRLVLASEISRLKAMKE